MEEWKNIKDFNNYQISNFGRIKNINSGKLLSQNVRNGYYRVGLYSSPKQYSFDVHRLVALHFLEEPSQHLKEAAEKTKYKKVIVNHKDGNKTNNHIDNLEWTDHSGNTKHSYKIGTHGIVCGDIMNLSENKYFEDVMIRYFFILIEEYKYEYRNNKIFVSQSSDDKALGIYNAMKELTYSGENVLCVNFDINFTTESIDNLRFIHNEEYLSDSNCDYLFIFNAIDNNSIRKICEYYNPKFIFHC